MLKRYLAKFNVLLKLLLPISFFLSRVNTRTSRMHVLLASCGLLHFSLGHHGSGQCACEYAYTFTVTYVYVSRTYLVKATGSL